MIKLLLTFGVGVYAGIYIDQNYKIPKVNEPAELLKKFNEYLEQHKKEK